MTEHYRVVLENTVPDMDGNQLEDWAVENCPSYIPYSDCHDKLIRCASDEFVFTDPKDAMKFKLLWHF